MVGFRLSSLHMYARLEFINRRNSGKEGSWPPNFRSFHRQNRPGPQDVPGIQELSTTRHVRQKLILKITTGN